MHSASLLLAAVALVGGANAFFRLPCAEPLVIERADPIISPGSVSGHTHTIQGASNFGINATYDDLQASECTSCLIKQDMSNYWIAELYTWWANDTFTKVPSNGIDLVYYLQRNNSADTTGITAFPPGFKMLTGNPSLRTYNESSLQAQAIGWNCLGESGTTRNPWLPIENCPNGLRAEVRFPSCWDGVNLYKSDQSHMAYSEGESGPCPSTHPVRTITLFYEALFSVDGVWANVDQAMNTSQPFVLAFGDPLGYGLHGDFMMGWQDGFLREVIDTCTEADGVIEECPILDLYDRTEAGQEQCHKTPDFNEEVGTNDVVLTSLPGCNPVTFTETTSTCANSTTPPMFSPTSVFTGDTAPPGANVVASTPQVVMQYSGYNYTGCYSDSTSARGLSETISLAAGNKTVNACLDAAKAGGYKYASVEYFGECYAGNTLASTSTEVTYDNCATLCTDNSLQYCGGISGAMDLYMLVDSTATAATSAANLLVVSSTSSTLQTSTTTSKVASTSSTSEATSTSTKSATKLATSTTSKSATKSATKSTTSATSRSVKGGRRGHRTSRHG